MIETPQSFRDMPRFWSDAAGRAWIEELPDLVERQCRRWDLVVDGDPLHGSNALVVPVRRRGGELALRMAAPGDDVGAEAQALLHWDGRGTVLVEGVDVDRRAMLLERLDGSRTLVSEPLMDAIEVLARLARTMAIPAPETAPATREIAATHVVEFERDWDAVDRPTPRSRLDAAVERAAWLAGRESAELAADGDLHFEQVLAGRRAPWIVVDPVLLRGDPEYDLGRVLWSRLDELDDRGVAAAFDLFVDVAAVPPERARAWVVVRAMSYLTWGLAHGLTDDPPRCVRLLDLFC